MSSTLNIKYPRLGMTVLVICAIISFFVCDDIKKYLESLILPSISWWLLKPIVQTAIIMSYLVPLVVATLLIKSKYGSLQVAGMFLGGIGLGALIRIVLIFAAVLYPYG